MRSSASRRPRSTVAAWSVATVSAIALLPAAPASATVTATKITSPAANTVVDSSDVLHPSPLTVTGTATVDGQAPEDDQVAIYAYAPLFGGGSSDYTQISDPVEVGPDGRFTAEVVAPLPTNALLLAGPSDGPDGPALGEEGSFAPTLVLGGFYNPGNFGSPVDGLRFQSFRGQQRGSFLVGPAGAIYGSGGSGIPGIGSFDTGSVTGGPTGDHGVEIDPIFLGTASLWPHYNDSRGPVTVDGVRGYLRDQIYLPTSGEGSLPAPTVTRTVDATTGGQTIVQTQLVYRAADPSDYPDDEVLEGGYVPSGLELQRTTVQDHDGQQATVSDVYRSTDGQGHRVDLLYSEGFGLPYDGRTDSSCPPIACPPLVRAAQRVAAEPGGVRGLVARDPGSDVDPEALYEALVPKFRVPWESGATWERKAQSDPLTAPPAGASTVYSRFPALFSVLGNGGIGGSEPPSPEDIRSVYGAITFGSRPDGGVFVVDPLFGQLFRTSTQFVARFVRDVPADGSTPITQVYSQGRDTATVEALAADAERRLTPAAPADPPKAAPPAAAPPTAPVPLPTRRLAPKRLTLQATPNRDLSGARRFRFSGQLSLPKGSSAALCGKGGVVSIQIHAGRNTISTRRVRLDKRCRYNVRVAFGSTKRFGSSKRLTVGARWGGNSKIGSVRAKSVRLRIR